MPNHRNPCITTGMRKEKPMRDAGSQSSEYAPKSSQQGLPLAITRNAAALLSLLISMDG